MALGYWIPTALETTKSPVDLLQLDMPFMQQHLYTASDFVREASPRGFRLDARQLEELHRTRVLIPFFRVDLKAPALREPVPLAPTVHPPIAWPTTSSELFGAAREGRLADPAVVGYEPWPTERRRSLWPTFDTGYLYSHHQLLGLVRARAIVDRLQPRRGNSDEIVWQLPEESLPDEMSLHALQSWRSLAVILSAIDTVFLPDITNRVSHDVDIWRAVRREFDSAEALAWLGLSEVQVRDQAEKLLIFGSSTDVLGDFYDLVRRADPSSWASLRGPARVAMDERISAELLWLLVDRLTERKPVHPHVPISQQRLSERRASLDSVLTRLQVSPQPAVVVGLEGATEMDLMPQVLELLGIPQERTWIQLVDFGGTTRDLSLLARYASEPLLGEDLGEAVLLDRPVTRFLVLTDAENLYSTRAKREKQRKKLLRSVTLTVPADLRGDLLDRKNAFVDIRTWGKYPFEFAHFTDREIANGLLTLAAPTTYPGGLTALIAATAKQRANRFPNIKKIWPQVAVDKVDFAATTWPLLKRKIDRAIERETPGPPIMRAAVRAYELALKDMGKNIVLRRGT